MVANFNVKCTPIFDSSAGHIHRHCVRKVYAQAFSKRIPHAHQDLSKAASLVSFIRVKPE